MLVWCMLVVGLKDEMKNQHAQVIVRYALFTCFAFTSGAIALLIMLISRGIQCLCFASNSKWYLTSNGAKDGIFGALRLISCFKGPSLIPQHHLVDITLPQLKSMHMCKLSIQTLSTYVGGANATKGIHETYPNPLHMVKMLGQATWIQI